MSGDFWSRRREAVAEEARAEEAAVVEAQEAEREAALAEKSDEELLTEAGFVAPEELETPEAVREFLSSTLPQRLKTRALRRLWRLNPVLANVDGLVDYGQDFTDSAMILENMQTTYQVGKGMLRHVEEMMRQAEAAEASEAADDPAEAESPADEMNEVPLAAAEIEEAPVAPVEPEVEVAADPEVADLPPAPRRRMAFTFDEQRTG